MSRGAFTTYSTVKHNTWFTRRQHHASRTLRAAWWFSELWRLPLRTSRRYWSAPLDAYSQDGGGKGGVQWIIWAQVSHDLVLQGIPAWYNHTPCPPTPTRLSGPLTRRTVPAGPRPQAALFQQTPPVSATWSHMLLIGMKNSVIKVGRLCAWYSTNWEQTFYSQSLHIFS